MASTSFDGRVAIVTGASRGIGRAIASALVAQGASAILCARDGGVHGVAEVLGDGASSAVTARQMDLADPESPRRLVEAALADHGQVDILVNNAGILRDARLGMVSEADLSATLAVNLVAPLRLIELCGRLMRRRGGGSIVNVASIVGLRGNAGQAAYSASKGGLIALTRTAAKELAPHGVRVNAVAPGVIDTGMIDHLAPDQQHALLDSIALGRTGTADEVADAVVFLCGDMARYVTGHVLSVDGGMVL